MKCFTREEYLGADDLPLIAVPLPEKLYGKDRGVFILTMDGTERAALEQKFTDKEPTDDVYDLRSSLLLDRVVNENGERLFSKDDRAAVMGKNAEGLEIVFEAICANAALRKADIDVMEKNSETSPPG